MGDAANVHEQIRIVEPEQQQQARPAAQRIVDLTAQASGSATGSRPSRAARAANWSGIEVGSSPMRSVRAKRR